VPGDRITRRNPVDPLPGKTGPRTRRSSLPRPRTRFALCWAAASVAAGPFFVASPVVATGSPAQVVLGRLVEAAQSGGQGIGGAMMTLVDAGGRSVEQVLTRDNGLFRLTAPAPGRYRLRADRIGYASTEAGPFQLAAGDTVTLLDPPMAAAVEAVSLDGLEARADRRCRVRPEEGLAVTRVWEEARKALAAAAWTQSRGMYRYEMMGVRREMDREGRMVLSEDRTFDQGYRKAPFVALPADSLMRNGFAVFSPSESAYRAPDAAVLLSDLFLDAHCFKLEQDEDRAPGLVGLAFEPVPGRRVADVAGTLWLDPATAQLQWLDFRYRNLDIPGVLLSANPGGRVSFRELPNGTWIVHSWEIRMPRATVSTNPLTKHMATTLDGITVQGGDVLQVHGDAGLVLQADKGGRIAGIVFDSLRQGLPGARVFLEGGGAEVVTNREGRFEVTHLRSGVYAVNFSHPYLDRYGYSAEPFQVEIGEGDEAPAQVNFAAPSVGRAVARICRHVKPPAERALVPGADPGRATGILAGQVADSLGQPMVGALVRVLWRGYGVSAEEGVTTLREGNSGVAVATDASGRYLACWVPVDTPLEVEVLADADEATLKNARLETAYHLSDLIAARERTIRISAQDPYFTLDLRVGAGNQTRQEHRRLDSSPPRAPAAPASDARPARSSAPSAGAATPTLVGSPLGVFGALDVFGALSAFSPTTTAPRTASRPAPPAKDTVTLAPIVVSVLRSPARLDRLPFAASVLSRQEIAQGAAGTSIEEALHALPGVRVQNRHNLAVGERISIRGFGARSQFGVRGIKVLVDGIPATLPDGQSTLDHLDIGSLARVEALRGPAAAWYGNAAGGVLLFRSAEPFAGRWHQGAVLAGGSNGMLRTEVSGSGTAGGVQYRASYGRTRLDGFRDNPSDSGENPYAGGARQTLNVGASLGAGGGSLTFRLAGVDLDALNPGSLPADLFDQGSNQAWGFNVARRTRKHVRQMQAGAAWQGPLGGLEAEASAYGARRVLDNPIPTQVIDLTRNSGGARLVLTKGWPTSGGTARLGFGADAEVQSDDRRNFANMGGSAGDLTLDQQERVRAAAVFGHARLPLSARVEMAGAVRFDHFSFRADDRFVNSENPDDSGTRAMSAINPSLGLYADLGRHGLFASVARSFETPTTTELANQADRAGGLNPGLDPQHGWTVEAGVRGSLGLGGDGPDDAGIAYDLAAFSTRLANQLVPFEVAGAPGRRFFRNAGKSTIRGVEASVRAVASPSLSSRIAYSFVDARFDDFAVDDRSFAGNRVPGVAPHHLEAAVRTVRGPWFGEFRLEVRGHVPADDANQAEAAGYALVGLRFGATDLQAGSVRFSPFAGITNVTDARYASSVVVNAFGGRYFEPGPARGGYVGASVSWSSAPDR